MSNVVMPQQKQKPGLSSALQLAAVVPGPHQPFAAGGAVLSGMSQKQETEAPNIQSGAQGAMQRRMQSLQSSQSNLRALRDADSALASLPPEQAQQYAPAIKKARTFAEQEYA